MKIFVAKRLSLVIFLPINEIRLFTIRFVCHFTSLENFMTREGLKRIGTHSNADTLTGIGTLLASNIINEK